MGTNWNTGGSLWTSGNTLLLWGWLRIGTGCPRKLWGLHPRTYSEIIWTWSWTACSRWPCLSRDNGPNDLQRSLPTYLSVILLFLEVEKNLLYNERGNKLNLFILITRWYRELKRVNRCTQGEDFTGQNSSSTKPRMENGFVSLSKIVIKKGTIH